jgi:TonB-linked SusC/RagA family outer membrane protein
MSIEKYLPIGFYKPVGFFISPRLVSFIERNTSHLANAAVQKPFLFLITWLLSTMLYAQEKLPQTVKVSLNYNKITLKDAFKQMEKQSGYSIGYGDDRINALETIAIHVSNRPLEEVLNQLLGERGLSFGVLAADKAIIIQKPAVAVKPVERPGQPETKPIVVQTATGRVTDSLNEGLPATSISIKGSFRTLATDEQGGFSFPGIPVPATLVFRRIGFEPKELEWKGQQGVNIILTESVRQMEDVSVASTGYQQIKRSKTTGSYTVIDNSLLNRGISTNILDRLKGIASGVLFDDNAGNSIGITIRGRSTIFGNSTPLIVLDNYPYEGALDDINPNDIESITILKDAVAAAIWGTRAGNGVIVIQSKKGVLGSKPTVSFSSNFTFSGKPDLYQRAQLSSAEYIDVQQFLFGKGYYASSSVFASSPAVQVMFDRKNGLISANDSLQQINALKQQDVRDDLTKYFYQRTFNQQYQVNVRGGTPKQTYYFSAGYDNNRLANVGSSYNRFSLKGNHALFLLDKKLQINTDLFFTSTNSNAQQSPYILAFPYAKLADANGKALEVVIPSTGLNPSYTDTAGGGKLMDWKYRPLDELNNRYAQNKMGLNDYRVNLTATYKLFKGLSVSGNYQYNKAVTDNDQLLDANSFYVRDKVNTYTQVDPAGVLSFPFPKGEVFTNGHTNLHSHFVRAQLNFEREFSKKHFINAIAGYEVRSQDREVTSTTLYGYNRSTGTSVPVDFETTYLYYYGLGGSKIALSDNFSGTYDRNRSVYGNFSYVYDKKYIFTGSIRKDESNLFGVNANQRGVPLWSVGAGWIMSKENFYQIHWLPYTKFSVSYGYNGNVDNSLSAYLTVGQARNSLGGISNLFGNPYYNIVTPPNPSLIWERVRNINYLFDFATLNNRISGTIEYYNKNGLDLIGNMPVAQQNGLTNFSSFRGNSANIGGNGVDVQLNSINMRGKIRWESNLLFNYNKEKVKDYKVREVSNSNVVQSSFTSDPLVGYPVKSVFAYRYAGLDTAGNPLGYLNGKPSTEYSSIQNASDRADIRFYGSLLPRIFGSLRNSFAYKNLSVSFNIIYKFNYFFKRPALDYSSLFSGNYQMPDFDQRWKQKGDELVTTVPSMVFSTSSSAASARSAFYTNSEAVVEKGDHIRLQDIQFSVLLDKKKLPGMPFKNLTFNFYASNLGIIWRANNRGLDPEALSVPLQKNYAIGLRAEF